MKGLIFLISALVSFSAFAELSEVKSFGKNEGALRMFVYTPKNIKAKAPLIVLLHGCAQGASSFDDETGFAHIAEQTGSLLLLPEQSKSNNFQACYNWFLPSDIKRDKGEASSIASMIEFLQKKNLASTKKVFVTGLSAGGAMTAVMLATYPELFSAGATVAGVPYGCAKSMIDGFTCMRSVNKTAEQWKSFVTKASTHRGVYPRVMIFQGESDPFVSPANAVELAEQWGAVHQASKEVMKLENSKMIHKSLLNKKGKSVVETIILKGMSHGIPVDPKSGCGRAGQWVLDHGVCAAELMSKFFGLK